MNNKKFTTCLQCGQVHFIVSLVEALAAIESFNKFFDESLTDVQRQEFYKNHKASLDDYTKCAYCSTSYKNFRVFVENDCPDGCTINPILDRTVEVYNGT